MEAIHMTQASNATINCLPDSILRRIFRQIDVDFRLMCLERVCRRWRQMMPYDDCVAANLNELHEQFCSLPYCKCRIEDMIPYPFSYSGALIRASKTGIQFVSKFRHLQQLTINGWIVSTEIANSIWDNFPRLNSLNLSNCFISAGAADIIKQMIDITSITLDGAEMSIGAISCMPKLKQFKLLKRSLELDPENLAWVEKLRQLHIASVPKKSDFLALLHRCSNVTDFSLKYSRKAFSDDRVLFAFCNNLAPQLKKLTISVSTSMLDSIVPPCWANLTHLNLHLSLPPSDEDGLDISSMLGLRELTHLTLACRLLKLNTLVPAVIRFRKLVALTLSCKEVSGRVDDNQCADLYDSNLHNANLSVKNIRQSSVMATKFAQLCTRLQKIHLMPAMFDCGVVLNFHNAQNSVFNHDDIYQWEKLYLREVAKLGDFLDEVCLPRLFDGMLKDLVQYETLYIHSSSPQKVDLALIQKSTSQTQSIDSSTSSTLSYGDVYGKPVIEKNLLECKVAGDCKEVASGGLVEKTCSSGQENYLAQAIVPLECKNLYLSPKVVDLTQIIDLVKAAPNLREISFHSTQHWDVLLTLLGTRPELTKISLKLQQNVYNCHLMKVINDGFGAERREIRQKGQIFLARLVFNCYLEKKYFNTPVLNQAWEEELAQLNVRFRYFYI